MCNWRNQPKDTQRRLYRRIPHPHPTALRCSGSRNHPRREIRSGAGYLQDGATSIAYQHRFVEAGRRMSMVRITIDIDGDDALSAKEAVAMLLEPFGKIRVVIVDDGKGKK